MPSYHHFKRRLASPSMLVALEKINRTTPCGEYYLVTTEELASLPVCSQRRERDWPLWALLAALWFRQPEDRGVGDTIARELGGTVTEAFKRHHEAVFGIWAKPCGCQGQVDSWNALYSYSGKA